MELTEIREILDARAADLTGSRFSDVQLASAQFDDVNLQGSTFRNVNLSGAQFEDVNWRGLAFTSANLGDATFDDVNLQGSTFTNVNMAGAQLRDVNLAGARIQDANLQGLSIDGVMVADLIRALGRRARMVLYAKDLAAMQDFYRGIFQLTLEHAAPDHVVLGSPTLQLTIVQVPAALAATIHIADPPVRRTQTPVKLVFDVESISAARAAVPSRKGGMDPAQSEWIFQGCRVCDGHDPEGNVLQFQQRDPRSRGQVDLP